MVKFKLYVVIEIAFCEGCEQFFKKGGHEYWKSEPKDPFWCGIITGRVSKVPRITSFEFKPFKSVKLKDVKNLDNFLRLSEYLQDKHLPYNVLSKIIMDQINSKDYMGRNIKIQRIWVEKGQSVIK